MKKNKKKGKVIEHDFKEDQSLNEIMLEIIDILHKDFSFKYLEFDEIAEIVMYAWNFSSLKSNEELIATEGMFSLNDFGNEQLQEFVETVFQLKESKYKHIKEYVLSISSQVTNDGTLNLVLIQGDIDSFLESMTQAMLDLGPEFEDEYYEEDTYQYTQKAVVIDYKPAFYDVLKALKVSVPDKKLEQPFIFLIRDTTDESKWLRDHYKFILETISKDLVIDKSKININSCTYKTFKSWFKLSTSSAVFDTDE